MRLRINAVLLTALLGATTLLAQTSALQQAAATFKTAQEADKVLSAKPPAEQTRSEVLKVIDAYQRVYVKTPSSSYSDDALVAIARLYETINEKAYAVKTLAFLISQYPQSPFKAAAEQDIARLNGATETATAPTVTKTDTRADAKSGAVATIDNVRYWEADKSLRVVVDVSGEITYKQGEARSPDRVFIDISPARLNTSLVEKAWPVKSGLLQKIRVGQNDATTVRVVLDVGAMLRATSFTLRDPSRLVIDVVGEDDAPLTPAATEVPPQRAAASEPVPAATTVAASAVAATPVAPVSAPITIPSRKDSIPADTAPMATAARPTAQGSSTFVRTLGLKVKTVVIDAGHGGHDTGSIGPTGFTEKELVLDVATRLKTLIESEIGCKVVLTRSDDTFVPLETRTAIANQQDADLFISIHANSSPTHSVRGVETYFLNFNSSKEALEIASRENAASERSIHELDTLLRKIALTDKVNESRELAQHVQTAMAKAKGTGPDRGIKQAPFVVLIGAIMPSILAEISFISNPDEEHVLRTPEYRQHIAESLLEGVRSYFDTLSGVKTAKSLGKN